MFYLESSSCQNSLNSRFVYSFILELSTMVKKESSTLSEHRQNILRTMETSNICSTMTTEQIISANEDPVIQSKNKVTIH